MRRTIVLALAFAAAACVDQPTGPTAPDAPSLAVARAPADANGPADANATGEVTPISFVVSPARSLGYTETDDFWRYPNRPEPDVGGDRVVWRFMANPYFGSVDVLQARLSTGGPTRLAQLSTYAGPRTSGRYTTWQDGLDGIAVLDNTTGRRQRVAGRRRPYAAWADVAGDRMAFPDIGAREVVLYDLATGARTTVASYVGSLRGLAFDGRYIAWIEDAGGTGLVVYDTRTGETRQAVPPAPRAITGVSADRGRVVFGMEAGDRQSIFLYDVASGQTRRLSSARGKQAYPEISGDLVVWDDTRNETNPYYVYDHDVYLYDLATGTETALAGGPTWSGDPQIDGSHVVWTEWRNNRWEVLAVEVAPPTVAGLRSELKRMAETGAVRNAGTARSLDVFLAQAAAAQSAGNRARAVERLRQFSAQVAQHAGRLIEASAAERLRGIAAGVIARM